MTTSGIVHEFNESNICIYCRRIKTWDMVGEKCDMDGNRKFIYPQALRDLAWVPRWTNTRVARRQSVAEHSWFVTIYAEIVAVQIGWYMEDTDNDGNLTGLRRSALLHYALWHDVEERVTGDMPGPGKRTFVNIDIHRRWVWSYMSKMFGNQIANCMENQNLEVMSILRVANRLDEVFFLADETSMGNRHVTHLAEYCFRKLKEAWFELPAPEAVLLAEWETVRMAVEEHRNPMPVVVGE